MLVLVADKLPAQGLNALRELGLSVDARPDLDPAGVADALAQTGADILVVRSTKVTEAAIMGASALSLVIRAGAGVNTIDLDAASRAGVFVANCPGKNAIAVAELTMGLLLSLDRQIPDATADLRGGRWRKKHYGKSAGLYGRTLGLVGFGSIAREVATRAAAFGMKVGAYARSLTAAVADEFEVHAFPTLEALLEASDVVSVHVPYSEATHHMIGKAALDHMREGALLLHTARGGVVDDDALRAAVATGKVRAGLDVFENEPSGGEAAFEAASLGEGIYGTPHIGASTSQAQEATADEVVRIVKGFMETGEVANAVNVLAPRPHRFGLVVRHRDRVGVLAHVLTTLREEDLNVQEMQNVIFNGNEAASASITVPREPTAALLEKLRGHDDILAVSLRSLS